MTKKWLSGVLMGLLCAGTAWSGSFFFDFNSDPAGQGLMTITGNGGWYPYDGVNYPDNPEDGFLKLTEGTSANTRIIFADFDEGAVVQAFTFECDLRIGNGSESPADGFSVNYCRANDPVLTGGAFAEGQNCEANLPEEGTQTGISIGFDAWDSGGTAGSLCSVVDQSIGIDVAAVTVRVDGILVMQFPCPTRNPSDWTDPTSIQTGPWDGVSGTAYLHWARLKVQLAADGKLNVWWKGTQILTDYQTTYFPSPGRLVFAGRTGSNWQNQDVDNISITTVAATLAQAGVATGNPGGFTLDVTDSGSSVVNPATANATIKLDGGAVTPITGTKTGATTTFAYRGFPTLLASGSTHTVEFTCEDGNGNSITAERTFTVPAYVTIPAADAVTGVDTSKPGYRIRPWQSPGQPNQLYWLEEQLLGLHGANEADLTSATNNGYINFNGLVNFNVFPASDGLSDAGSFNTGNGYPDAHFPGLPGANGLTGSTAIELLTFLKFDTADVYTMVVNSDDGFLVSEGKNPSDRFANRLGLYNGGKGASDVSFTIAVTNAGIYPVRLVWENGNGEGTGNGANLEWFTIKNGVKYLINDPSPTNTSGIAAYYIGPTLPAYVSHFYPFAGATGCRADKLVAQITDGASQVNQGSIQLLVDGVSVNPISTKVGGVTTVTANFTFANLMLAGTRTATLIWSDAAGAAHSNNWSFAVAPYTTLNPGLSVPLSAGDTGKPGFTITVAQMDPDLARPGEGDGLPNQMDAMDALIGGLFFPYYGTNTADVEGWYSGIPADEDNKWFYANVMDFNSSGSPGDFASDQQLPGIPGATGRTDNFAAWIEGWLPLNAGYYRMSINSDDGFRVTQGIGITRQVLHVNGPGIDRDVAAIVTWTGNSSFGAAMPVVPISGPVAYFDSSAGCPLPATDLTGKIAAINNIDCLDRDYVTQAQAMGAIGCIIINDAQWGLPYVLGGDSPSTPITIPVVCVNGFGGEEQDIWAKSGLVATLGRDANLELGIADYGKGMSWVDFSFAVPQSGLYPIHVLYEQGGGGAGFEWATVTSDSLAMDAITRTLIHDASASGSLMAYREVTAPLPPTLSIGKVGADVVVTYTGTLQSSTTANGGYADVVGASSPYTVPTSGGAKFFRARR